MEKLKSKFKMIGAGMTMLGAAALAACATQADNDDNGGSGNGSGWEQPNNNNNNNNQQNNDECVVKYPVINIRKYEKGVPLEESEIVEVTQGYECKSAPTNAIKHSKGENKEWWTIVNCTPGQDYVEPGTYVEPHGIVEVEFKAIDDCGTKLDR